MLHKRNNETLKALSIFIACLFLILTSMLSVSKAKITEKNAYDFEFVSIDGLQMKLASYKNKVLLVVNTASQCGFTGQYSDLQTLWNKYKDKGLIVIGVPSADFGNQEFNSNKKVKEFCSVNFNIDFPMTQISSITGDKAHPFFRWAADTVGIIGKPRWNFHKFLIDPEGKMVEWFSSTTGPMSAKVTATIETQIAKIKPE